MTKIVRTLYYVLTNEEATATRTARKIIKEVFANIPETEKKTFELIQPSIATEMHKTNNYEMNIKVLRNIICPLSKITCIINVWYVVHVVLSTHLSLEKKF